MEETPKTAAAKTKLTPTQLSSRVVGDKVRLEFLIEDLARQLIIDRGSLVANGCNGCNSCA